MLLTMKLKSIYQLLTNGDKILIVLILLFSVVSLYAVSQLKTIGEFVIIEANGIEEYRLPLTTAKQITVNGPIGKTIIEIDHHMARVIYSDCPAKICVKTGTIHRAGEMIVCAPNKVVVRIVGKNNNSFDVITK